MIRRGSSITACRALSLLGLLATAGCGDTGHDNSTTPAATPTPVARAAAPRGHDWADVVTRTPDNGYRMGNPDAPIKLIEYGSRTCPHCAAFAATGIAPLVRDYVSPGKVSYEFRDWLKDGGDVSAALIGRCKGPAGFFPLLAAEFLYQPTVFAKESNQSELDAAKVANAPEADQPYVLAGQIGYLDFAHDNGISDAEAKVCLADIATAEAIGHMNARAAQEYGLEKTPTFVINGKKVAADNWPKLEAALKAIGG